MAACASRPIVDSTAAAVSVLQLPDLGRAQQRAAWQQMAAAAQRADTAPAARTTESTQGGRERLRALLSSSDTPMAVPAAANCSAGWQAGVAVRCAGGGGAVQLVWQHGTISCTAALGRRARRLTATMQQSPAVMPSVRALMVGRLKEPLKPCKAGGAPARGTGGDGRWRSGLLPAGRSVVGSGVIEIQWQSSMLPQPLGGPRCSGPRRGARPCCKSRGPSAARRSACSHLHTPGKGWERAEPRRAASWGAAWCLSAGRGVQGVHWLLCRDVQMREVRGIPQAAGRWRQEQGGGCMGAPGLPKGKGHQAASVAAVRADHYIQGAHWCILGGLLTPRPVPTGRSQPSVPRSPPKPPALPAPRPTTDSLVSQRSIAGAAPSPRPTNRGTVASRHRPPRPVPSWAASTCIRPLPPHVAQHRLLPAVLF